MTTLPKVSIIIITYLEKSKRYLDLCVDSIRNLNYDHDKLEVLIVTRESYQPQYDGIKTIYPEAPEFYPAEGINFAMRSASPESRYFFILNDDVILTKNCLKKLVEASQANDDNIMLNPLSPCDNDSNYSLCFGFYKNGELHRLTEKHYRYDDLIEYVPELMQQESLYGPGFVMQNFLCIFCTLIPRKLYELVGDWDERFKTGQDDLDYSLRAKDKGFVTASSLDALAWHFGGVSVETTLNQQLRYDNVKYFKEKWGFWPPGLPKKFIQEVVNSEAIA